MMPLTPNHRSPSLPAERGFTLIELIVAGLVAALVAAAAGVGLAQTMRVRTSVDAHAEAQRRADLAAESIRRDLQGVLRDGDLYYVTVRVIDKGDAEQGQPEFDELLIFTQSDRRVRAMDVQPESGEYEVQYRAAAGPSLSGEPLPGWSAPQPPVIPARRGVPRVTLGPAYTLWRRADPMPDDVPEGGGIVMPITEGITRLSFLAFDGQDWESAWDSDSLGVPHAVRVLIEARDDTGRATATALRTIAIDRVPIPYVTASDTTSTSSSSGGTAQ